MSTRRNDLNINMIKVKKNQPLGAKPSITSKHNALQIIDGLIVSLSRGGPGQVGTTEVNLDEVTLLFSKQVLSDLRLTKVGPKLVSHDPSFREALYLARASLEVLYDAYSAKIMNLPLKDQFGLFRVSSLWSKDDFVTFTKYTTVYPMAKYLRQEMPKVPVGFTDHPLLYSGAIKRILKNRLNNVSGKNTHLWSSVLQGIKRSCASVSEDFVYKTMLKHKAGLSSTPSAEVWELDNLYVTDYVERCIGNFKAPRPQLFEASASASIEAKRSIGGGREYIRSMIPDRAAVAHILDYETSDGHVVLSSSLSGDLTFEDALELAHNADIAVMTSAVLEPLKARLITKGSAPRQWVSRFMQKAMQKHLAQMQPFVATKGPIDLSHIISLETKTRRTFPRCEWPNLNWVSGDYSAATDTLNMNLTKVIFETILNRCGYNEKLKEVLRSVIYDQEIRYPATMEQKGGLDPFQQTNGQLMGSILSFPILCIANLVIFWKTLEEFLSFLHGRPIVLELNALPVIINGDDILFKCPPEMYKLWQRNLYLAGFSLSLGKNYYHRTFLTINSQSYHEIRGGKMSFKQIFYVNTGLLTGQSKITGRQNAKDAPLWDIFNEVMKGAINKPRMHRRFIHYHSRAIKRMTYDGKFNLFIPHGRGGLGFKPYSGLVNRLTSFQRRYATFVEKRYTTNLEIGELPPTDTVVLAGEALLALPPLNRSPPVLMAIPKYGPYPEHVIPYVDKSVDEPLLALDRPEENSVKYRFPKKSLKTFSEGLFSQMSTTDIYMDTGKIGEWVPNRTEEVHTTSLSAGPLAKMLEARPPMVTLVRQHGGYLEKETFKVPLTREVAESQTFFATKIGHDRLW